MSETRRSGHSKLVYDKTKQTIVAVDEGSLPWDDCKVAFGVEDSEAFERWMEETDDGKGLLPTGWSLCEIDGSGARYVAVFRVDGMLREVNGQAVRNLVPGLCRQ